MPREKNDNTGEQKSDGPTDDHRPASDPDLRKPGTSLRGGASRGASGGMPFDIRPLTYVLAAAEQLSFSAAANALNTRVSSVSRRVRELEDAMGVALFERNPAGVRLTDAGRRFIAEVVPALRMLQIAFENAGAAGRAEIGTLRIGIVTTLAGGFLRDVVTSFRDAHGGVRLEIHDGGTRQHFHAIRSRDLDIAFVTGTAEIPDCDSLELWRERIHVAMPAGHPLAARQALDWPDLRDERFIVTMDEPGPEVHDYFVRHVSDYGRSPDVSYRSVTQETLMHLVAIGEGITLVSEGWTSIALPDLALRPLTSDEDIVPLSAVWLPQNDNPVLRRFLSCARVLSSKLASRGAH